MGTHMTYIHTYVRTYIQRHTGASSLWFGARQALPLGRSPHQHRQQTGKNPILSLGDMLQLAFSLVEVVVYDDVLSLVLSVSCPSFLFSNIIPVKNVIPYPGV